MSDQSDPIVGHKTFSNDDGSFRHEPLRESEAVAMRKAVKATETRRRELMPDEQSARYMLFEAYQRLKELGWNDAIYCPKDGTCFDAIEIGSTGVHQCRYDGEWPNGYWWILSHGDLYPSRPVLYRATKLAPADQDPE